MPSNQPNTSGSAGDAPAPSVATPSLKAPQPDTPTKGGKTLSPMIHITMKEDVEKEIDAVIQMGHCHTSDYRVFLDRILPVDADLIENQLKSLKEKGALSQSKKKKSSKKKGPKGTRWKWNQFPQSPKCEADYYAPLVALCEELCPQKHGGIPGRWGNLHNKAPRSVNEEASNVRPDVGRTASKHWELQREELASLAEQLSELPGVDEKTGEKRKAEVTDLHDKLSDELKRLSVIWWMQLLVPVEIKGTSSQSDIHDAIRQLAGYMRLILREQLDRRFVIGLILCGSKFSVWLCDRSGLLGIGEPIDYCEHPELFVQAIIALNTLTPEQLGFDNTMKLFKDKHRIDTIPSYERSYHETLKTDELHPHFMQWVIEITVNGKKERYVTVRTLSITGAENVSGRATIVWEAAKFEEMNNPSQVYVIKQYWRPYNAKDPIPSEADLHETAGISGRLVAHEDLKVAPSAENKEGVLDTTLEHIRKGIESRAFRVAKQSKKEPVPRHSERDSMAVTSIQTPEASKKSEWTVNKYDLESRVRNRMLFSMWGFPVKFFKDRVELLTTILNAVEDHEQFYNSKVLHRDISMGNILIVPTRREDGYDFSNTKGHLIDLDHAKSTTVLREPARYTHTDPNLRLDILRRMAEMEKKHAEEAVYQGVLKVISDPFYFGPYLSDAIQIKGNKPPHSCASLGWPTQTSARPNFQGRQAQKVVRTGTVPFMSAEVLERLRINTYVRFNTPFFHDTIHDMESFFWLLLHFALTQQPGGEHRSLSSNPELQVLVNTIFTDNVSAAARIKHNYLSGEEEMEPVIDQVDQYFDFLKPFLTRWWKTLQVASRYRAFEYETIHTHITEILKGALEEARKLSLPELRKDHEVKRREDYYNNFRKALKGNVNFSQPKRVKTEKGTNKAGAKGDGGGRARRSKGKGKA